MQKEKINTHFSIRHCKYFLENCRHLSDLWPEVLRQLRYSFFSWNKKPVQKRHLPLKISITKSLFKKIVSLKSFKATSLTKSHSCKWSKGKMPFSGGTGLSPLFPPNAPPAPKPLLSYFNTSKRNRNRFPSSRNGEALFVQLIFSKVWEITKPASSQDIYQTAYEFPIEPKKIKGLSETTDPRKGFLYQASKVWEIDDCQFSNAWKNDIFKDYNGKLETLKRFISKKHNISRKIKWGNNLHVISLPALIWQCLMAKLPLLLALPVFANLLFSQKTHRGFRNGIFNLRALATRN